MVCLSRTTTKPSKTPGQTSVVRKDRTSSDAFGKVSDDSATTIEALFKFTARPYDEDGKLQNNLNRWYDLSTGRWVSTDPIGFEAGDVNLYRYVGNRTAWIRDPWGLLPGGTTRPRLEILDTVEIERLNTSNLASINQSIKAGVATAFPATTYNSRVIGLPINVDSDTAGLSGIMVGATLKARYDDECNDCDFTGTRIGFMAFYAVISEVGSHDIAIGGTQNDPITIEGPTSTKDHELWHTDGAVVDYDKVRRETGIKLTKRRGYKFGAEQAADAMYECFYRISVDALLNQLPFTNESCFSRGARCISTHLTSLEARLAIFEHGLYHNVPQTGRIRYRWSQQDA